MGVYITATVITISLLGNFDWNLAQIFHFYTIYGKYILVKISKTANALSIILLHSEWKLNEPVWIYFCSVSKERRDLWNFHQSGYLFTYFYFSGSLICSVFNKMFRHNEWHEIGNLHYNYYNHYKKLCTMNVCRSFLGNSVWNLV